MPVEGKRRCLCGRHHSHRCIKTKKSNTSQTHVNNTFNRTHVLHDGSNVFATDIKHFTYLRYCSRASFSDTQQRIMQPEASFRRSPTRRVNRTFKYRVPCFTFIADHRLCPWSKPALSFLLTMTPIQSKTISRSPPSSRFVIPTRLQLHLLDNGVRFRSLATTRQQRARVIHQALLQTRQDPTAGFASHRRPVKASRLTFDKHSCHRRVIIHQRSKSSLSRPDGWRWHRQQSHSIQSFKAMTRVFEP